MKRHRLSDRYIYIYIYISIYRNTRALVEIFLTFARFRLYPGASRRISRLARRAYSADNR